MFDLLRTSTFRLALFYFALFATSVTAVLGFIYWQTVVYADSQTGETIEAEITGLAEQYRELGLAGLVGVIRERSDPERGSSMLYLLTDSSGHPIAGNLSRWPDGHIDPDGWLRFRLDSPDSKGGPQHVAQGTSFLLAGGFQLLVGHDLSERLQFSRRIIGALTSAAVMTLALGLLGGIIMSRSALRRIDVINRASAGIMAGDPSRRIPLRGSGDEFDQLATNLNTMLDRIERLMAGMREVTDNVAHDLRSPLGRLRNRVEAALAAPPSDETSRAALEQTIEDADQLLATFTALLDIAELEAGAPRMTMETLDLTELAHGLVELYEPVAEEARLKLAYTLPNMTVPVHGNRQLLSRAIANLIENALKYTPQGGTIGVSLQRQAGRAQLVVNDTGPGIPAEFRERAFDRFYRLEASRTTPGNGLGLSLVRAVARMHGGTAALGDVVPGQIPPGLRVMLDLPAL